MTFENYRVVSADDAIRTYLADLQPTTVLNQLRSLLDSYEKPAQTAVVESNYIDLDYAASYYDQRVRSFSPPRRETTRIHFFSKTLTIESLVDACTETTHDMQHGYLGFVVVRPDNPKTLGRTFLKCPDYVGGLPARFPTRSVTSVDLTGIALKVDSCPYMSQDSKVMACATVALWMSTSTLASKMLDVPPYTTDAITRMAKSLDRSFGPVVGKQGLSVAEMERALFAVGFDPGKYPFRSPERLTEFSHLLSDSGIPPILLVGKDTLNHAITVVGYTLKHPAPGNPSASRIVPAHHFISGLVLHDDQRGMYLLARAIPPAQTGYDYEVDLELQLPTGGDTTHCYGAMAPLPRRVMLDVFEAKAQTEEWVEHAVQRQWIDDRQIIARTILVGSNTLKETLHDHREGSGDPNPYPPDFVREVRGLSMPRFIWLVELSYMDEWDFTNPASPSVVADLIMDSTATGNALSDVLLFRAPNLVAWSHVDANSFGFQGLRDPSDHPHPPFPDTPRP